MLLPGTVYFVFVPRQGVSAPVSVILWGWGGVPLWLPIPQGRGRAHQPCELPPLPPKQSGVIKIIEPEAPSQLDPA